MFAEISQDQTEALANLATDTQADCQDFTTLTETKATMTKAHGVANEKLSKANAKITCLNADSPQSNPQRLDLVGYCWRARIHSGGGTQ